MHDCLDHLDERFSTGPAGLCLCCRKVAVPPHARLCDECRDTRRYALRSAQRAGERAA